MLTKKNTVAAAFYQPYINASPSEDVIKALEKNGHDFKKLLNAIPRKKRDYAYQKDKWTVRVLIQHLIDAERVFNYRALRFSRKDDTHLQSFNENTWAAASRGAERKWSELVDEFKSLRKSTEYLFRSFNEDQLLSSGTASEKIVNVLALGHIIAGHTEHHMKVLRERYLNQ